MRERPPLKPGDKVRGLYGVGVVESNGPLWLRVRWEVDGPMNHQPSFAYRLERLPDPPAE